MSTDPNSYDEDDFEPNDPQHEQQPPANFRKQLARVERERDEALARAQEADRLAKENALFKANLGNLNEDQQKAIMLTSSEMTSDAYRSQAERLGFVEPATPEVPAAELEAFDRVATATAGGQTPDEVSYETELRATRNEKEALAVMAKYNKPLASYD